MTRRVSETNERNRTWNLDEAVADRWFVLATSLSLGSMRETALRAGIEVVLRKPWVWRFCRKGRDRKPDWHKSDGLPGYVFAKGSVQAFRDRLKARVWPVDLGKGWETVSDEAVEMICGQELSFEAADSDVAVISWAQGQLVRIDSGPLVGYVGRVVSCQGGVAELALTMASFAVKINACLLSAEKG